MKSKNGILKTIGLIILAVLVFSLLLALSPLALIIGGVGYWYFTKKKPDSKMKKYSMILGIVGLIGSILLVAIGGSDRPKNKTNETSEVSALASSKEMSSKSETKVDSTQSNKEAEEKARRDPNNYPTIAYDEMARNGDAHAGENLQITGKVIQVQDDGSGGATLRIATSADGYDDVYLVQIDAAEWTGHRLLEDDLITVYGVIYGLYSYETVLGNKQTVPAIVDVFY
ncbi:hypothetical protein D3X11_00925 [Streptococcus sp. X16XC17]|uniref:hypothetical protein n=1 Tax=unclassified Streptococcus TaxID=2608887 RepID=UPI00066FBD6D|nr:MULTISPECIES: hypothetical protein [unclassified Streptococcus]TCD46071.1 hypothetical protein D3X11_00925 [Streptococcus sp. X16XC17]